MAGTHGYRDPAEEARTRLLDGLHHIAFITADMDRLIGFYERVFGAPVIEDMEEEGLRHAFIEVGPGTLLHPFQIPGIKPPGRQEIFQRGRLDHFAFNVASEEAFWQVRRRVVAEGAGDGLVTDMGPLLTFSFTDPDEGWHEVVWSKPGAPVAKGSERANWRTVEID